MSEDYSVSEILAETCRLCACKDYSVKLYPIFGTINHMHSIPIMIRKCINIDITEKDDCLNICENCLVKLDLMYQLYEDFKNGELDFKILLRYLHTETASVSQPQIAAAFQSTNEEILEEEALSDDDEPILSSKKLVVLLKPLTISDYKKFCNTQSHDYSVYCNTGDESLPSNEENGNSNSDYGMDFFQPNLSEQILDESLNSTTHSRIPGVRIKKETQMEYPEDTDSLEPPYACEFCDQKYATASELDQHIVIHEINPDSTQFVCEYCNKRFKLVASLFAHMRMHENDMLPKESLINPTAEGSLFCVLCNLEFKNKSAYEYHIRAHKKEFRCEICGKQFAQQGSLKPHLRIHTGVKPFKCEVCGKSFTQRGNLLYHKKTHVKSILYTCKVCSHSFTKSTFKQHMKVHPGDKPFKCELCRKSYWDARGLHYHSMTHDDLMHKCEICFSVFPTKATLNTHMQVHTGAPFIEFPFTDNGFNREFINSLQKLTPESHR